MSTPRPNKADKREAAREQARLAREKRERAQRRRRWLIPAGVTVAVLAIVAVVALVVSSTAPAPQTAKGPANMISDGILFTGVGGKAVATTTGAIPAKGTPSPHPSTGGGVPHIVEYIDFACPYCNQFESTNAATIQTLVAAGKVTLEVKPVAILDRSFEGTRYASRAINAGACVANFSPNDFLTVMNAFYAQQPQEQTPGLTNSEILALVHGAGVHNTSIDACIRGESFKAWVAAATQRFLNDPANKSIEGTTGTPTIFVNGKMYADSLTDATSFDNFLATATTGS